MRVVAGKYRGKNLASPKDDRVRPTTTRIKETLFNVLQGYSQDAVVLDLFAGSGALGIECISRGAKEVVFVDNSKDSIELVRKNLQGIDGNFKVVNSDFSGVLRNAYVTGKKFDMIFVDPPYASGLGELALGLIFDLDLLADGGVVVFEHGAEKTYEVSDKRYKQRTKKMGTVVAEFISRKSVALMAGSFDPFTKGHEAVLDEALCEFDEVWVACLVNPDKKYTFNSAQRLALCECVCAQKKGAKAIYSEKYAVEVASDVGASVLIRGIRGDEDKAYEDDMAKFNREHGFETLFIEPNVFSNVSSTKAREQIAKGDYSSIPACCVPLLTSKEFADLK
ncbi:MAG TPA: 16S rRNA (guanine(966)-N(2))-methyltransferase RsmD [Clostridiales bacterium]|nr:16S rRNA (guanine(966)-N(2))-methyltransferase RsmD [Clostridiales bacterium]